MLFQIFIITELQFSLIYLVVVFNVVSGWDGLYLVVLDFVKLFWVL